MIHLRSQQSVTLLPGFNEGLFCIQNITAAAPLKALQLSLGSSILDMCAAPGTKTTQLAELTLGKARIFATDIDNNRLKKLHQNIERLDHSCIEIMPYDSLCEQLAKAGLLDFILLDVPCSNTGVLAKSPEVRHRVKPKAVDRLIQTQVKILNTASAFLKPSGRICYTTCSILNQENTNVVTGFLSDNPDFVLESEQLTLPSSERFDRDGGYYAIIKKA
jgi:16S rRNA (cytosine967-C5)-methyltransferase